jgi:hypothetical protein
MQVCLPSSNPESALTSTFAVSEVLRGILIKINCHQSKRMVFDGEWNFHFFKPSLNFWPDLYFMCDSLFIQMEEAEPPESEDEEQYTQRPDGSSKKKVSTCYFLHRYLSDGNISIAYTKRHRCKLPSSEMDPAEIRYIRNAFIKERGVQVFEKSVHPVRSSPPRTAVGKSETNCQCGNEIHLRSRIGGTCVGFFKG